MNRRVLAAGAVAAAVLGAGVVYAAQPRGQASHIMRLSAQPPGTLFNAANLNPGQTLRRCVQLTNDSPIAARVFLHSARGTGDLAEHLTLTIQAGEQPAGADINCTGFLPETGPPIYDGPLGEFPVDEDHALVDAQRYPPGYQRTYQLQVTVDDDVDQGLELTDETFAFSGEPADPPAPPTPEERDELPELVADLTAPPITTAASSTRTPTPDGDERPVLELKQITISPRGQMRLIVRATSPGRLGVRGHLVRSAAQPLPDRVRQRRRPRAKRPAPAIAHRQRIHIGTNRVTLSLQRSAIARVRRYPGRYAIRLTTRLTTRDLVALRRARVPNTVLRALAARTRGR